MPLASVQELDAKFLVIETSMKVIWLERELEELEEKCQITAEKKSTGYIDRWEKSYSEAVWTIHGYSHVPLVCAVMVKVVDLLVGPLRWSHVASYYAIVGVTALAHKQRPTTPIIIVAFPSIMPAVVSGSLTKLAGAFFCFETICSPVILCTVHGKTSRTVQKSAGYSSVCCSTLYILPQQRCQTKIILHTSHATSAGSQYEHFLLAHLH